MINRTMATVYVNQDSISVKTCSRKGCSPQRFIILKKELQRLEEKKYLITKDIHSYVELRICDAVGGAKVLELSFTWLKDAGRDSVSGYTERVRLPYEPFRSYAAGEEEVAEELIFDDITTGASQDIKQATRVARAMVTKYGMSDELGLVSYDSDEEVFLGRDYGHTKGYGENVASKIDSEVKRIVDECYDKAKAIILDHRDVLDAAAALLLEKEKISREEFEALFEKEEAVPAV